MSVPMGDQKQTPTSEFGSAVAEVTELTQRIVQQEIELAKTEISEKVTKLAKGAAVGAAAGVFVVFALVYLGHAAAWGFWKVVAGDSTDYWLGFLFVAVLLLVLAAIAGFLAYKFIKGGAPPTPQMAIDEGKKVKATITESGKS
jgi:uncharacterized membrane protein YqjE